MDWAEIIEISGDLDVAIRRRDEELLRQAATELIRMVDTGTAVKTGVEIKSSLNSQLNHISDDYDLTSNDTRRGD